MKIICKIFWLPNRKYNICLFFGFFLRKFTKHSAGSNFLNVWVCCLSGQLMKSFRVFNGLFGQEKQFENITLGSEKLWWAFFTTNVLKFFRLNNYSITKKMRADCRPSPNINLVAEKDNNKKFLVKKNGQQFYCTS